MQAAESQGGLMSVLAKCGVPREFGEQVLEAEAAFHGQIEQRDVKRSVEVVEL